MYSTTFLQSTHQNEHLMPSCTMRKSALDTANLDEFIFISNTKIAQPYWISISKALRLQPHLH